MSNPKCFAPAMLQRDATTLIFAITKVDMVEVLRKILALLLFHISHEVSIMRDANDFLLVPLV
jgi:hypothetical protein